MVVAWEEFEPPPMPAPPLLPADTSASPEMSILVLPLDCLPPPMPAPPSRPSALWMRTFEMVTVVSSEAPAPPPMAAPPLLNAPSFLWTMPVESCEPMVPPEMVTVAPAPRPPPMPAPPFLPSSLPTAFL